MRAAILGTGFMGRVHLEAVRRLGNVEAEMLSPRTNWQALLPAFDAVHICTPNALHEPMARVAIEAGKHVICEKPLTTSSAEARGLVDLARARSLRNCTCHNLRCYPMVQQMRAMREAGELGDILVVQGTYSQDWLLYEADWNWRIESKEGGPSRTLADIGSHWCDMAEHVTGLRISSLCADLQTFHKTRRKPRGSFETFSGKSGAAGDYDIVPVDTEDFASVIFRMGDRTCGAFTASQVAAGRKNRLLLEIFGTKSSVAWNQERPDELWIGHRDSPNRTMLKDPSLMNPTASGYADLPGGHSEGYDDTFKQVFRRFYASIAAPDATPEYPQFSDGLRQLQVLEAELASNRSHAWVEVPSLDHNAV